MRRILRYSVPVDGKWHTRKIGAPPRAVIARAESRVDFWTLEEYDEAELTERCFRVFATGEALPDALIAYWGTSVTPSGDLVRHLIEDLS